MAWRIEVSESAKRVLAKLDSATARRLIGFLRERLAAASDPRALGKPLKGPLRRYWRYRVGDFRLICDIQDQVLCILVVALGHRKDIYD